MIDSEKCNSILDAADEYKYEAVQAFSFGMDLYEDNYFSEAASKFLLAELYFGMYKNLLAIAGKRNGDYQDLAYKKLAGVKNEEIAAMNALSKVNGELINIFNVLNVGSAKK